MSEPVDLLSMCTSGGCGSKAPMESLDALLDFLRATTGTAGEDDPFGDASVVEILESEQRIVSTLDFGTPISNDSRTWGYIASENALSDLWISGATPVSAMAIVGWPNLESAPMVASLNALIGGAQECLRRAGIALTGGHTMVSRTPFFGLSATGVVDHAELMSNAQGVVGQRLVMTKPIGSGFAVSGHRTNTLSAAAWEEAIEIMRTSNASAAKWAMAHGVRCATDVSGFGLVGAVGTLARRSGVAAVLVPDRVLTMQSVSVARRTGVVSAAAERTMMYAEQFCANWSSLSPWQRLVLSDPQTSGGMLMALDDHQVDLAIEELPFAAEIGSLYEGVPGTIAV